MRTHPPGMLLLTALVAACSTTSSGGGGGGTSTATESICGTDPRAMAYAVGLTQTSADKTVKASFLGAMPAPPERGENAWTLKLMDAQGSPMNGAVITAKPFMPDHGHGTSVTPTITPMGADGAYQIADLDLFMPGIWTITLTIKPSSGPLETLVFSFCIDG